MSKANRLGMVLLSAVLTSSTAMVQTVSAQQTKGTTMQTNANDEAGIHRTMAAYNVALNGGQTSAVLPLYTQDGVFMAPYTASNVGIDAVHAAYDAVFKELKFDVRFTIVDLVQMAPDWAYVRTNSAGTTAHASTGKTTSEANQELFVLQKGDDGQWRIARYSFSPTNPPSNG